VKLRLECNASVTHSTNYILVLVLVSGCLLSIFGVDFAFFLSLSSIGSFLDGNGSSAVLPPVLCAVSIDGLRSEQLNALANWCEVDFETANPNISETYQGLLMVNSLKI
jgi:hypothetical protein